ncbi:MAG: hypothetical protein ACC661_06220, partial [Verrucomicrobiales bacterium]
MISLLRQGYRFARENDLKTVVRAVSSKDAHPLVQFFKYGFCGGLATVVHLGAFYLIGYWFFPQAFSHEVT